MDKLQTFAERLRYLRKARRLNLQKLASLTGIGFTSLSQYENGIHPNARTLVTLADYYGVAVDWLIKGANPPPPAEGDPELDRMIAQLKDRMRDEQRRGQTIARFEKAFQDYRRDVP